MQTGSVIDTSPVILAYDKGYISNGSIAEMEGACVTDKYFYPAMNVQGTLSYHGMGDAVARAKICIVYRDNGQTRVDYWSLTDTQSPRKFINIGSDAIAFTLETSMLDDCYAYIVDTGQILFAGRNSIYYGHKNISELS